MSLRLLTLNLVFKELEWFCADDLKNRIVVQKTIYILAQMGFNLRYRFRWYSHGPYSSDLSDDVDEIMFNKEFYNNQLIERGYRLKESAGNVMEKFKDIFPQPQENAEWLELVASVLFAREHWCSCKKNRKKALKNVFLDIYPKYRGMVSMVDAAVAFIKLHFKKRRKKI